MNAKVAIEMDLREAGIVNAQLAHYDAWLTDKRLERMSAGDTPGLRCYTERRETVRMLMRRIRTAIETRTTEVR